MVQTEQRKEYFIKSWTLYLVSKWKSIVIISFVCGLIGLGFALTKKVKYKSELTFVLSNEDNNDLASITSQFGINLGSNNDAFSGNNIINLFKSRKMVRWALFQKIPKADKKLVDLYVDEKKLVKSFHKKERLQNVLPFPDDTAKLTPLQDSLLREIHIDIINNYLSVDRPDTKLSFFKITTVFPDELFSCYFTKYLVDATSKLYIDTKTTSARLNLAMLQNEADSVNRIINNAITATGAATDQVFNLNPSLQVHRTPVYRNQFNATVNEAAYTEVLKNLELAKISLQKQSPIYLILDEPHLPLLRIGQGKLIATILGFIIGSILGVAFFISHRIFKTVIES